MPRTPNDDRADSRAHNRYDRADSRAHNRYDRADSRAHNRYDRADSRAPNNVAYRAPESNRARQLADDGRGDDRLRAHLAKLGGLLPDKGD